MTNLEKIRNASENELALILMCPYDLEGGELPCGNMPLSCCTKEYCNKCLIDWLHKEAKNE